MSDEEFQKLVLAEFKSLRQELQNTRQELQQELQNTRQELQQELQNTRQELLERFDRLERHSEENVVATLTIINNKVSDIRDSLLSISEVLGDHEVRIRNLTRRPV